MVESQVRKLQTLLERKIEERGYTQLEVEKAVGWEKGTLDRLLTGEVELSVKQAFMILGVIGVDPEAFFAELYGLASGALPAELAELKSVVGSVVNLLVKNGVVTADAVVSAVAAQARPPR